MILALAMVFSFMPVSAYGIQITDTTAPTLVNASRTSNTKITVTLSENCVNLTKADSGGFTVTETGGMATYPVSATAPGDSASHVVLTVADISASCVQGVTVTYTKVPDGTITDVKGNALETNSSGVAVAAWDGTLPTLVSASLTSDTSITLALSKECQKPRKDGQRRLHGNRDGRICGIYGIHNRAGRRYGSRCSDRGRSVGVKQQRRHNYLYARHKRHDS